MVLDDGVRDAVEPVVYLPRGAQGAGAERPGEPRRREEVDEVEPGHELERRFQLRDVLVPHRAPVADGAPHQDVVRQDLDPLADVHGGRRRRRGGPDQARRLFLPDGAEGEHGLGAQQLRDAEPPELLPVAAAAGREGDVPAAVGEDAHGRVERPVGEDGVVGLQDLPRRLGGGDHHRGDVPQAEEHDGAVPLRQPAHGVVRQGAQQAVHVPDDRQRPWPGRQVQASGVAAKQGSQLEEHGDDEDAERGVQHSGRRECDSCHESVTLVTEHDDEKQVQAECWFLGELDPNACLI